MFESRRYRRKAVLTMPSVSSDIEFDDFGEIGGCRRTTNALMMMMMMMRN